MGELKNVPRSTYHDHHVQELFKRVLMYQKHYDLKLNDVNMNLGKVYQDQEDLRVRFGEFLSDSLLAAEKEAENMNDIAEVKTKVNDIDTKVDKLVTDVALVNNTVTLKFQHTEKILSDIQITLQSMNSKMDSFVTKDEFNSRTDSKRFTVTTWVSIVSAIGSIAATIVAVLALNQ